MKENKIAIVGAGGFGREVKTIIEAINNLSNVYDFIGFYDDNTDESLNISTIPILGDISTLNQVTEELAVVVAIGNPNVKKNVLERIVNPKIHFPTLIHPQAMILDKSVEIGKGCIICAGTIITCNITIRDFVILNLSCTVGHDTVIQDFSSFMPSVNISGEVLIKESVYVGTGAKIINQLEIGENTIIGAGAVVSKNLPANCTAVGIPAKPIKFHS